MSPKGLKRKECGHLFEVFLCWTTCDYKISVIEWLVDEVERERGDGSAAASTEYCRYILFKSHLIYKSRWNWKPVRGAAKWILSRGLCPIYNQSVWKKHERDTCALSPRMIRMTPGISCRGEETAEAKEAARGVVSQRKNYNSSADLAGEIDLVGQSRDWDHGGQETMSGLTVE